jgi:hypothetical protein
MNDDSVSCVIIGMVVVGIVITAFKLGGCSSEDDISSKCRFIGKFEIDDATRHIFDCAPEKR